MGRKIFNFTFAVALWAFIGMRYAQVKSPQQGRVVASQKVAVQLWYDASFKM